MKYGINFKGTALIIILSVAVLFSCSEAIPVINRFEDLDEIPNITAENVEMSYTEKGFLRGTLTAKVFQTFDNEDEPHTNFPEGIKIVLFNKEHKIETDMVADSAIYYQSKKSWVATGNVVIKNVNGTVLRTEKLYGDEKEKKIFTDKLVKITKTDGTTIVGRTGFESNTEFTIYKFMDVRGKIFFKDEFKNDNDPANNEQKQELPDKTSQQKKKYKQNLPENIKKPKELQRRM